MPIAPITHHSRQSLDLNTPSGTLGARRKPFKGCFSAGSEEFNLVPSLWLGTLIWRLRLQKKTHWLAIFFRKKTKFGHIPYFRPGARRYGTIHFAEALQRNIEIPGFTNATKGFDQMQTSRKVSGTIQPLKFKKRSLPP
jgi:hypothetical protein